MKQGLKLDTITHFMTSKTIQKLRQYFSFT